MRVWVMATPANLPGCASPERDPALHAFKWPCGLVIRDHDVVERVDFKDYVLTLHIKYHETLEGRAMTQDEWLRWFANQPEAQRRELIDKLTVMFCRWCGADTPCYCMRDD